MPRAKIKAFDPHNKDKRRISEYHQKMSGAQGKDLPVSKKHDSDKYVSRSLRNFQAMCDAAKQPKKSRSQNSTVPAPTTSTSRKRPLVSAPADDDSSSARPAKKRKSNNPHDNNRTHTNTNTNTRPDTDEKSSHSTKATYKFKTEMKEGESWKSYCKRIGLEKRAAILANAQKLTFIGDKRKRYLSGRKEGYQKHLESADEVLAGRAEANEKQQLNNKQYQSKKKEKEKKQQEKGELDDDPPQPAVTETKPRGAVEFAGVEKVQFGDIVDRPPTLTVLPKRSKPLTLSHSIAVLSQLKSQEETDMERIPEHARPKQAKSPHAHSKIQNTAMDRVREQAQAAYKLHKQRTARSQQPTDRMDEFD